METQNQQDNPQAKGKSNEKKYAGAAANVATAVGVGTASYAFGRSSSSEDDEAVDSPETVVAEAKTVADDNSTNDVVVVEASDDESVVVEAEEVVLPEPIASTDGIDYEIDIDPEPISGELIEPDILPDDVVVEDDGIINDDISGLTADNDVAIDDTIGDSIQQDLFA